MLFHIGNLGITSKHIDDERRENKSQTFHSSQSSIKKIVQGFHRITSHRGTLIDVRTQMPRQGNGIKFPSKSQHYTSGLNRGCLH